MTTTTVETATATELTRRGERSAGTSGAARSGRRTRLPSAGVTACSDDGSSSARDVPAAGSPAEHTHGPPIPRPRGPQLRNPQWPAGPPPRPRIVDEPGILGLSRLTRGRFGSRLFNWFFVLVFAVILIQMISAILENPW
jgi:hypothetical protein